MKKLSKIWLWIFLAMFIVPEILFFTTVSLIRSIAGESFFSVSSLIINYGVFFDNPFYLILIIALEWIGILGLLILCIKSRKKVLSVLLSVILVWLSYVFCVVYVTGFSMNF